MNTTKYYIKEIFFIHLLLLSLFSTNAYSASNFNHQVDRWLTQYSEIEPKKDKRVAKAHDIFQRVLNTAVSTHRGTTPFLKVIDKPTLEVFALRGGGVILTSGALNKCYENTQYGDDRLAFVLGHEIAHQVRDDFWHAKFFHAIGLARIYAIGNLDEQESLDSVKEIASRSADIMAKEIGAEEHGIV